MGVGKASPRVTSRSGGRHCTGVAGRREHLSWPGPEWPPCSPSLMACLGSSELPSPTPTPLEGTEVGMGAVSSTAGFLDLLCLHRSPVNSCPSPWPLQMAGLQVGRKIYSINEDLVFTRPFSEVETVLNQSFCSRRPLRLLVATKAKE